MEFFFSDFDTRHCGGEKTPIFIYTHLYSILKAETNMCTVFAVFWQGFHLYAPPGAFMLFLNRTTLCSLNIDNEVYWIRLNEKRKIENEPNRLYLVCLFKGKRWLEEEEEKCGNNERSKKKCSIDQERTKLTNDARRKEQWRANKMKEKKTPRRRQRARVT